MGSAESTHITAAQKPDDGVTVVSRRTEGLDPILHRLHSLKIPQPLLKYHPSAENSLTDILLRKPSTHALPGNLDPKVIMELVSMYCDWQEEKAKGISKKQDEIRIQIEMADALAVKLLHRFNYSVSAMKTATDHFSSIPLLELEVGELKGRLTEIVSTCDALCKRISTEGPEVLRSTVKPFGASKTDQTEGASQEEVLSSES